MPAKIDIIGKDVITVSVQSNTSKTKDSQIRVLLTFSIVKVYLTVDGGNVRLFNNKFLIFELNNYKHIYI